jgi:hypothetical protein
MLESRDITNITVVPLPLDGTEPVPFQPMHVQTVPPSVTGLETLQLTEEPSSYKVSPTLGLGLP